jgi:hypothetical protein
MGARERERDRNKRYNLKFHTQFEVLTVVTVKSNIIREVTPCSPVEIHHQFRVCTTSTLKLKGKPSKQ